MAVTASLYEGFLVHLCNKEIDLTNDTLKVALVSASYTPNRNTHSHLSDVTNELSGGNYARQTLSGQVVASSGTNVVKYDATDTTFSNLTGTARRAVIFDDTATSDPLVGFVDFGQNETRTAQNLTIEWNASGIFTITAS